VHARLIRATLVNNVTGRHQGPKRKLRAGYSGLQSGVSRLQRTSYLYVGLLCYTTSTGIARFFCAMCVFDARASSLHLGYRSVPNFVSVAPSNAELAHGEKSRTQ